MGEDSVRETMHEIRRERERGPRCTFDEICEKEVINICDGRRLGFACNCEVNTETGSIVSLIVPGHSRFWGLWKSDKEYCIPWRNIVKIGEDVILVDVPELP